MNKFMKDLIFVLRSLKRSPFILLVNVAGLGLAFTTVILTLTFIRYELSYDQHFTTKGRVVRLYNKATDNTSTSIYSIGLRNAYLQIPANVPEVEAATQIYRGWEVMIDSKERKFDGLKLLYADKEFFKVFGLDLIYGNQNDALLGEKKIVFSQSTAQKVFHRLNCIGEVIKMDGEPYTITGVTKDLPKNSHFRYDLLISMQTIHPERFGGLEFYTYFLLSPNADQKDAGNKIAVANNKIMVPWAANTNSKIESGVEPLTRLYMHSIANDAISARGNFSQIILVSLIAAFVLLIAVVSFINLYIIQGEKRISEIATRKMFGARKAEIARLFFLETGIVFLLSVALASFVTYSVLPSFAELLHSKVDLSDLLSTQGIALIGGIMGLLFLITASYPVLYLSKLNLVLGLRGRKTQVNRKISLSAITVMVQFIITAFFICSIVIILAQVRYLKSIPLGFDIENVTGFDGFSPEIKSKFNSMKAELEKLPFVRSVGCSDHYMGGGCSGQYIKTEGGPENANKDINEYRVLPGFCETMHLSLAEGRFFNDSEKDKKTIILNESAVKMLGFGKATGKFVDYNDDMKLEVIGVVKDFYYLSNPGASIEPLSITNYSINNRFNVIYMKSSEPLSKAQMMQVKLILRSYDPDYMLNAFSLKDTYTQKFQSENRLIKMVTIGTLEVILISLIGLLALSILNIARRTREIGIRKVLGSSEFEVIQSLLKETLVIVSIAMLIAFTGSYFVMKQWLSGYVNKIDLNGGYFLVSAAITFLVAILATIWQSWHAATRNPVDAVKHE
jgi:putative ABC transport system permease protein